jgi:hypothetical protein
MIAGIVAKPQPAEAKPAAGQPEAQEGVGGFLKGLLGGGKK